MKLENVTSDRRRRIYDDACGTALALEFVGERWSLLIMRELVYGPRRFGEVRANLPGISANVLTQRLDHLERAGILVRRLLPSPANVQVYDLTEWGREAAPLMRDLGRWAARSPRHDPMLFMSPASAMMSLETLVDRSALAAFPATTIAFDMGADRFALAAGPAGIAVRRGEAAMPHVRLTGDTMAMRRSLYGKEGFDAPGLLTVDGDADRARAFARLFALPEKVAANG